MIVSATTIDSADVTIQRDAQVTKLTFEDNDEIRFLPVELDISFPVLEIYEAGGLAIKTIAKVNFKNMRILNELGLNNNQITTIASDTFEDLVSLEVLLLGEEKVLRLLLFY